MREQMLFSTGSVIFVLRALFNKLIMKALRYFLFFGTGIYASVLIIIGFPVLCSLSTALLCYMLIRQLR